MIDERLSMIDERLSVDPDCSTEWEPVEIMPRTPATAKAVLHHRHGTGVACAACEIVALRRNLAWQLGGGR